MHPALLLALIPLWNGEVTVEDGVSKGGLHWRMAARVDHRVEVEISTTVRPFYDAGGMSGPVTARDPMMADHGEDAGPQDETYVEGVVYKTVASLRVETAKRTVVIHARPAPAKAIRSYRALKNYRFFMHWFAKDDAAIKVTALDKAGKVLAEWPPPARTSTAAGKGSGRTLRSL
jgi:hypothetical protein